jgi:hypothetical protein
VPLLPRRLRLLGNLAGCTGRLLLCCLPDLRDFVLSSAIVLAVSVSCDED